MKSWNNTYRKRAMREALEYRKIMQLAPADRDEKRLRKLKQRLGV